jgi:type I restriction enzyme S subunit
MWEKVSLSNVAEVIAGQSPESKYYNNVGNGIPFFQGKADFGLDYPTVRYWCTQPTKIAKPLDILFSVRAPVGIN